MLQVVLLAEQEHTPVPVLQCVPVAVVVHINHPPVKHLVRIVLADLIQEVAQVLVLHVEQENILPLNQALVPAALQEHILPQQLLVLVRVVQQVNINLQQVKHLVQPIAPKENIL